MTENRKENAAPPRGSAKTPNLAKVSPELQETLDFAKRTGTHDRVFKYFLSKPGFANRFLKWALPEDGASDLEVDLSQLEQLRESFLDEDLKSSFADLLFRAPAKAKLPDGTKAEVPCYLFFILEHKSSDSFLTVFQILRYTVRVWERDYKEQGEKERRLLPFVFPIIFHNGPKPFLSPTNLGKIVASIPGLEKYAPFWEMKLIDLRLTSAEELPKDEDIKIVLETMKDIWDINGNELIARIYKQARRPAASSFSLDKEGYEALSFYVWQSSQQIDNNVMKEQVKDMSNTLDSTMLTSAFDRMIIQCRNEGLEEGLAEGLAEGLLRCVKIHIGRPSAELASLILGIRDTDLIDTCYDGIETNEIKTLEDLESRIRK